MDPATGKILPLMPANIVKGEDARDVAAYVASAVSKGGKDQGALASIGAAEAKGTAKEKNGKLEIPADPGGALSYVFANAEAPPASSRSTPGTSRRSSTTSRSRAAASTRTGEVVYNGGVSRSTTSRPASTRSTARVPGHRQAGMEGKLTVK